MALLGHPSAASNTISARRTKPCGRDRDLAIDSWITAQLVSKITLDKDIFAINYKIKTVNRIIYLIGVAQTKAELNKVLLQAKNIGSVKQVINHVQIK